MTVDELTVANVYLMQAGDGLYEVTRDPDDERAGIVIQTEMPAEVETFLHSWLLDKRVPGRDVYRLTDDQADKAADTVIKWEQEDVPAETAVRLLEKAPTRGEMVPLNRSLAAQRDRIWFIETVQFRMSVELERLKNEFKLAIGDADGIDLMATWMSDDSGTRELRFL
jgi:hypothetical protein